MIHAVTLADLPKDERPPCPECGGRPTSMGKNWVCHCGRSYAKNLRHPLVDYTTRPHCPYCDSQHTTKWGRQRMCCQECGRTFKR